MFNKLLEKQINKHFWGQKNIPPKLLTYLEVISNSYDLYAEEGAGAKFIFIYPKRKSKELTKNY